MAGERLSVLTGLLLVMLSAAPGYALIGDRERLLLVCGGAVAVALATLLMWWKTSALERVRFYRALGRLALCMALGLMAALLWYATVEVAPLTPLWHRWLPQGLTLGVFMHVLWRWWRPLPSEHRD